MSTTTFTHSTSHGVHAGPPGSDPYQIINNLRQSLAEQGDWQRAAEDSREQVERHEAMEIVLRNALHGRNALTAELGLRLVRAEEALADLAAQAWRLERENARLSAENRRLRGPVRRPGLRGRWSR